MCTIKSEPNISKMYSMIESVYGWMRVLIIWTSKETIAFKIMWANKFNKSYG